jgi:hypothetical protein
MIPGVVRNCGLAVVMAAVLLIHGCSEEEPGDDCGQCARAIDCVEYCGGPVLQSGCCPCPSGTFDDWQCRDAGSDAGSGGGGNGGAGGR